MQYRIAGVEISQISNLAIKIGCFPEKKRLFKERNYLSLSTCIFIQN